MRIETLEQRRVLSLSSVAISVGQQDQLNDGLDGLVVWADSLDSHDLMAQSLPTVGQSIGESIDFGDLVSQGLAQPVANYLAGDPTPTTDELVAAIQALDNASFDNATLTISNVDGGFDSVSNELVLDLEFRADRSLLVNPSLGPEGDALGFDFSSTVGGTSTLTFNFSFGLDLANGLTDEEAFFIRPASLSAEVDSNTASITSGPANIGFFAGQLTAGNLALDASMSIGIANPDSDAAGRVTLDELETTDLATLASLTPAGTASGSVTIDPGTLGSFSPLGNSIISFNSSDPFTSPTLAFNAAYDEVKSFTNLSSFGFVGVLDQFSSWLGGLSNSEVLDANVELAANGRIGDLVPLDAVVVGGVIDPLLDVNLLPTFATAQELETELAAALGLGVGTIDAQYNPTTKELSYRLIVNHAHTPTNVPVGFGLDLDPLSEFASPSTATLNASGGLDLTLGVSLDDLSAVMRSTTPAPANGQMSSDSNFVLNLGFSGDIAVSLSAAATSGNSSRADLVNDLNASLSAAGLSSSVVAGLDGSNHLTFSTIGTALGITALELRAADFNPQGPASTDPIVTQLGFRARHLAFDSLANHAFVENATITGSASLTATDIDGTARAGFLSTTIDSGSGNSSAAFTLPLKNPTTQTAGGRVGMFELFEAQSLDMTTVVDVPTLTGGLNVTLPLDANILGQALTTNPELTINWPNLSVGSAAVILNDGSEIEKFENLSSNDFNGMLGQVHNYLESLENQQGALFEIPGLGKSLSEVSEAISDFGTVLELLANDPAAGLEEVESWIEDALGLADENFDLSLVDDGDTIRADLTFADSSMQQTPLQVAFPFLSSGQQTEELLIGISASGLVNVDFEFDFQLSVGIDISDGVSLDPFIYESSHLLVEAEVNTQNIEFNANIGPLGLFIRDGELLVDSDGVDTTRDQAVFRIDFTDGDFQTSDGKIMLSSIGSENASASLTGQVNIVLPMYFPFQSDYIGDFEFRIGDLGDVFNTTTIVIPDLEEAEQEQEDEGGLLSNLTAILNGLDGWFEIAIDAFNGKVGGFDLPFVGSDLHKVADFLEEVQEDVIDQITDRFRESEGNTGAALQTALYLAVGPDGLNILKDRNGSGTVTIDDVQFETTDFEQDGVLDQVEFFMDLGQDLTVLDTPIDFDIGLPGLGLKAEGNLEVLVGYDWDLSFGVSNDYGFYLLTSQEDEIEIDLEIRIPDLKARGELAFLQLDVADEDADQNPNNDGDDVDQDGRKPSSFTAGLAIDFLDPGDDPADPNDDGKMLETEIEQLFTGEVDVDDAIHVELVGEAELNLDLLVSFEGDARFPTIGSEFTVLWSFLENNDPPEMEDDLEGELPTVAFTNITLNAGEFITDFSDGVLKEIQKFTEPIQPVVDFVTSPLPILSGFGLDLSPIEIAEALGYATEAGYVEAIANLITVINSVPEVSGQLMIPLGDFVISEPGGGETDLREEGAAQNALPDETPPSMTPVDSLKMADQDAGNFFDDLKAVGIELPLIEDPTSVFKLFLGQTVDLFLYDVPRLELSFPFPIIKVGPIIPPIPLFASFSGSIGAAIDLAVGFDTHGFQQAQDSGDWWDVFNGFYISDTANPDGTGEDVVEASLFGNLNASAELSLVVVGAGVSGGVDLQLTADLVDPNEDGKVHLDELIANIPLGVTGTFDLGGSITARLDAYVEFLFKRVNFTIAEIEVASFEFTDEDIFTDRFSGNNSFGTARFLGAGPGLHIDGLSLESLGDVDWFEFELLRPDSIEVDIRHSSVHGDIDIEIYDANQQLIAAGKSGEDREFAKLIDVPAGNYFVRVSGVNKLNNYQLAVEPDKSSDTRVIYVTPAGALDRGNAYFTVAPGNDKYDGLSYRKPKATLQDVLDDYDLGPNDVVVLETGTHAAGGIITAADEGALYLGTRAGSTLSNLRLENANDNYFHRVNFQSNSPGLTLFGSNNNVFDLAEFAGTGVNLVIDDSDNNLIDRSSFAGSGDGVNILGDANDDASGNVITRSEFQNTATSVDLLSHEVNTLDGNTFTGNGVLGVHLAAGTPAVLVGNDIDGRATGIRWESRVANVWDNNIHGGTVGIEVLSGVVGPDNPAPYGTPGGLTPNRVFANQIGVLVPESTAGSIVRHTEIFSNTIGVDASGDQTQLVANDIYNNAVGVRSSRLVGPDSWDINLSNLIHDNATGVEALPGAEVRFNRIYSNDDGIAVLGTANIHHNLIYRNTSGGLTVYGAKDVDVVNNTIYVPSGRGIHLKGFIDRVNITNNIVSIASGSGLVVDAESQFGYTSDYNNYHATGGTVASQGKGFLDLYDWQVEAESDLNSIGTTVLDPTLDDPQFVNLAGDDYHLSSGSTSIDAGNPALAFGLEPLANGNRVNLGAYGNTPQATQSPAQRLEITAPNFYVDLVPSRTYTLAWETNNLGGGVDLDIDLIEVGVGKVADIATIAASASSTTWSPGNFVAGNNSKRYRVRLTTLSGPSLVEESREPFSIVDHNPAAANSFYVNDGSTTADIYTTAIGDNRNTGLTTDAPKVVIRPLVLSYAMGGGDVVQVDSGDYIHAVNLNLAASLLPEDPRMNTVTATTLEGPNFGPGVARIDRANPFAGSTAVDIIGGDNMTLNDLTVVGAETGVRVRDSALFLDANRLILSDHSRDGLSIENDSDLANLDSLEVFDNGRHGIFVDSQLDTLIDSTVYDNQEIGVALRSVGAASVLRNEVYQNYRGIDIINPGSSTASVGTSILPLELGNTVHHNEEDGIFASGNVVVAGNLVHENANIGIRLEDGADAALNVVHQHVTGISALGSSSDITENRSYVNSVSGIVASFDSNVLRNVTYSNDLHGIHADRFSGVIDHNLVYSTGYASMNIEGPGQGAQITHNTVYEPCAVAGAHDPAAPATVMTEWDMNIFMNQLAPPHQAFGAALWGSATFEFQDATSDSGETFDLGPGGGTGAQTIEALPTEGTWTIDYELLSLSLSSAMSEPIPGIGFVETSLVPGPNSFGQLQLQNVGGTLVGSNHMELWVQHYFTETETTLLADAPVIVDYSITLTDGYGELDALRIPMSVPSSSSVPGFLFNPNNPSDGWLWDLQDATVKGPPDPPPQDPGETCAEIGVLIQNHSDRIHLRQNAIFVQGDPNAGPGDPVSMDIVVDSTSTNRFDSDFNALMSDFGIVGTFGGAAAATLTDWQSITAGEDLHSISPNPGTVWVDPDGDDDALAGLGSGNDDNFHSRSPFGQVDKGALAPVTDTALSPSGLPRFTPIVWVTSGGGISQLSALVDAGDPGAAFFAEPFENGMFANIGAYGNTFQGSHSEPEYVHLAYPIGAEQIVPGQTYEIVWRSHDHIPGDTVEIELIHGGIGGLVETVIDPAAANTGSYFWTVDPATTIDTDYTIMITRPSVLVPGDEIEGLSPFQFEIDGDNRPPVVLGTTPPVVELERSTNASLSSIAVEYSENVLGAGVGISYSLVGAGANGVFDGVDDVTYALNVNYNPAASDGLPSSAMLDIPGGPLPEGTFRLTINSTFVSDNSGNSLDGALDGGSSNYVRTFTIDQTASIVSIPAISPNPRNNGVSPLKIVFDEPVVGVGLADVRLTLDGGPNLLSGTQSLTSTDGITWELADTTAITEAEGTYTLELISTNSNILDLAGNPLATDATATWTVDTTSPTVDIVDVSPDPRNTAIGQIEVVFSEPVQNFTVADLELFVDGTAIGLTAAQTPTTSDNITWTIANLAGLTAAEGGYLLKIKDTAALTDLVGNGISAEEREVWQVLLGSPTVDIVDVSPDARTTAVNEVVLRFDVPVTGFDANDLRLTRDGNKVPLAGQLTISSLDAMNWHVAGFNAVTSINGQYVLTLDSIGSGIEDFAGNAFNGGASDHWLKDDVTPTVTFTPVSPDPTNQTVKQLAIVFSKPVTGLTLAHLTLTRDATPVVWDGSQSVTTSNGVTWTLANLAPLTTVAGTYELALDASSGDIQVFPGNPLTTGDAESWLHDPVIPTVEITDVAPNSSFNAINSLEFVFSEPVFNFDKSDLVLRHQGNEIALTASQTLSTSDNQTWTLSNLAPLTTVPGKYEVSLPAHSSGIVDAAANLLKVGTFETWRVLLPGDGDRDGDVDGRDFLAWQRGNNDADGDNDTDADDLAIWLANYPTPTPIAALISNPVSQAVSAIAAPSQYDMSVEAQSAVEADVEPSGQSEISAALIDAAMAVAMQELDRSTEWAAPDVEELFIAQSNDLSFRLSEMVSVSPSRQDQDGTDPLSETVAEGQPDPWLSDELVELVFG